MSSHDLGAAQRLRTRYTPNHTDLQVVVNLVRLLRRGDAVPGGQAIQQRNRVLTARGTTTWQLANARRKTWKPYAALRVLKND